MRPCYRLTNRLGQIGYLASFVLGKFALSKKKLLNNMDPNPYQSPEMPADVKQPARSPSEPWIAFWVIWSFFWGGIAGWMISNAVFKALMDVDIELHPDIDLLAATAYVMLLCGLLAAIVTWRRSFAKKRFAAGK